MVSDGRPTVVTCPPTETNDMHVTVNIDGDSWSVPAAGEMSAREVADAIVDQIRSNEEKPESHKPKPIVTSPATLSDCLGLLTKRPKVKRKRRYR